MEEGEEMHNLPSNLKLLRKQKRMTQQQVADHLNITHAAYNFYERGTREPNLNTLIKLAELFEVSLDILTGRYVNVFNNNQTVNQFAINGAINQVIN